MIEVKLLRPLDGRDVGATAEYPHEDAHRLAGMGVVEIIGQAVEPAENKMAAAPENKDVKRSSRKAG